MNHQGSPGQSLTNILAEALRLHQSGNIGNAETLYRQILDVDPGHADALHLIGVIAYQVGDNIQAAEYISKAIAINPNISFYHNNLGNVYQNLHDAGEAMKSFREAIHLKHDNVEAHNNLGNALRHLGRKEEALGYYRKAIEIEPDYAAAHNNLANLLKDLDMLDDAVIHYQMALKHENGSAEIFYNFGTALKDLGDIEGAIEQYSKAISINPGFAAVYNNIGNIYKEKNKIDDALVYYQKAISLKPDFAEAYNNIGDVYRMHGKFYKAEEQCRKAIQLKPGDERFYLTLGNIFLGQGIFDEAEAQYERASDMKPGFADAHYNRGIVLLMRGEFEEGWREYKWRFRSKEIARHIGYRYGEIPSWDGSPLDGKKILVVTEQGMGDHMQFLRYMPLLKQSGGRVVFECRAELMRLFEGYESIDDLWEEDSSDISDIKPDVCVQLLSLPLIFGTTLNNIIADAPYLTVDPAAKAKWNSRFDHDLFKVGLVWSGNPSHKNDHNRSCRLSDFAPLASVPGVAFYSLQKGGMGGNGLKPPAGMQIEDLGKDLDDFYDTAGVIENLDLVISVDTAVVHLAGAMGKPVWTLLPFVPDWRWMLDRDDTPWYPTMRLFRQPGHKDWESMMKDVVSKLEMKVHLKGALNE